LNNGKDFRPACCGQRLLLLIARYVIFTHNMTGKNKLPEVFSQHPQVMSRALVFKGTRVPVQTFFDHLDHGGTIKEFLDWYEGVTGEQVEYAVEIRTVTVA
jgi:uncharacterized protein (DUF433 family)